MENRKEQGSGLRKRILGEIDESIETKSLLRGEADVIEAVSNGITKALKRGNKVLIFGNGGSAADSQHFAAELQGRYMIANRRALPAVALTTDTSILTAVANDMEFGVVFSRQVEALCRRGDIVLGISTSGVSKNVIAALIRAKELGGKTIGFTGKSGGKMKDVCDICIRVPSETTSRIQESHLLIEHIVSMLVEEALSQKKS